MENKTPNRKRNVQLKFYVDEDELAMIKYKMTKAGIKNQSEYLRQMAVYGKTVNLDFSDLRPIYNELNKIGVNLNQIARIANTTGTLYRNDIADIRDKIQTVKNNIETIADNTDKQLDLIKNQPFETIQEKVKREMSERKKE
ncbi:MAG: plasmid mobilization relaxosome protein MobC [Oscillospiraceae bacterium]|nr:plasmid mobilization relaxosome protein MobC [Oscillospiraceae bacterium]